MANDTQNTEKFSEKPEKKFEERIITIRRVSKKTTGGNYVSFSALVAIGDGNGNVAIGVGRGLEVPPAIQKAIAQAKKRMVHVPTFRDTIPHQVLLKFKASRLLLKPAPQGTGLKVGGVVRIILDLAGVNNASGKIMGSRNQITNAYAVIEAIKKLKPRISSEPKTPEVAKEVKPETKTVVEPAGKVEPEVKAEAKPKKAKKTKTEKPAVTEESK